jgi:hypothetical protein
MEKYLRIPLLFLFVGSVIGIVLRWQFISPFPLINYTNVLHSHSHIMFLGWVFNAIYIAFTVNFIEAKKLNTFRVIFLLLQAMNIGMLIAFPLQGYGTYSIIFSTLHTILSFVFIVIYFRRVWKAETQSVWLSKVALRFCALSSLGPFSLAYIVANDLQNTHWYNYAIYFYLHFQYNGFFFFGIASLFVRWIENTSFINPAPLKSIWQWFLIACFPTYFLSILYSEPGTMYNVAGAAGACIQLYAYAKLAHWGNNHRVLLKEIFGDTSPFLKMISIAIAIKLVLQLLSCIPRIAQMAYEFRPITIGYLHLVLLGIISSALLVWYKLTGLFSSAFKVLFLIFLSAFVLMEAVLISTPWWPDVSLVFSSVTHLFCTAIILSVCCLGFAAIFKKGAIISLTKR